MALRRLTLLPQLHPTTSPLLTFPITQQRRTKHTSSPTTLSSTSLFPSRWLADVKSRLGQCLTYGCNTEETTEAGHILKELASDWRDYVVGVDGYLVDKDRRGLYKHAIVWGDMDSMAHVNNVVYVRWAESGRVNWCRNFATFHDPQNSTAWNELLTPKSVGLILKSIKIDYKFPITYPDRVTVYHKLSSISKESFSLDVVMLSENNQRVAARAEEDIVVYDYKRNCKTPIPDFVGEKFEETFDLQRDMMERCREKAGDLEERVKRVEECYGRAES